MYFNDIQLIVIPNKSRILDLKIDIVNYKIMIIQLFIIQLHANNIIISYIITYNYI